MNINQIPEEVFNFILDYLSIIELIKIERVCKSWQLSIQTVLKRPKSIICNDFYSNMSGYVTNYNFIYDHTFNNNYYAYKPNCLNCTNKNNSDDKMKLKDLWSEVKILVKKCNNIKSLTIAFGPLLFYNYYKNDYYKMYDERTFKNEQWENEITDFFDDKSLGKLECLNIYIDLYHFDFNWCEILSKIILTKLNHLTVICVGDTLLLLPLIPNIQHLYIQGNVWFKNSYDDFKKMNLKRFYYKNTHHDLHGVIQGLSLIQSNDNDEKFKNIQAFIQWIKFLQKNLPADMVCKNSHLFSNPELFEEIFKDFNLNSLFIDFNYHEFDKLNISLRPIKTLANFKVIDKKILTNFHNNLFSFLNVLPDLKFISLPFGKLNHLQMDEIIRCYPSLQKLELYEYLTYRLTRNDYQLIAKNNGLVNFWNIIGNMKCLNELILYLDCSNVKCFYKIFGLEQLQTSTSIKKIRIYHKGFCHKTFFNKIINICKQLVNNLDNQYFCLYFYIRHTRKKDNIQAFKNQIQVPKNLKLIIDK